MQIRGAWFAPKVLQRMQRLLNLVLQVVQIRGIWLAPKALQRIQRLLNLLLQVVQIRGTWLAPKVLQRMQRLAMGTAAAPGVSPLPARTPTPATSTAASSNPTLTIVGAAMHDTPLRVPNQAEGCAPPPLRDRIPCPDSMTPSRPLCSSRRLVSGNTLIGNGHGLLGVTPDKQVVWSFRDLTTFGNALPVAIVLDP